ncbi:MAG: glycosyltransferase family 4 protein [Chloroflexi bacterium]|nr:glycosyltransferase family 4 protein [Chloroflexota bacterium]
MPHRPPVSSADRARCRAARGSRPAGGGWAAEAGVRRRSILTWHIHGSYLYYLAQAPHDFYVPTRPGRPEGYGGRSGQFHWPDNVVEVPAERVRDLRLDLVVYQSPKNWLVDRYEILGPEQRRGPAIYLEHNTPKPHATDTRHFVDDPDALLVHVTHFNRLMWDGGRTPARVIEHGVAIPDDVGYTGELGRGIVVVNGLRRRNRIAGYDVFEAMRSRVPLDLAGMGSAQLGGIGDLPLGELHRREASYRFFFNPIRYTSLPLALVEAMAVGLPVVALATTEVPAAVPNGEAGIVTNDLAALEDGMRALLDDPSLARRLGSRAREIARERYGIARFVRDWEGAFACVLR